MSAGHYWILNFQEPLNLSSLFIKLLISKRGNIFEYYKYNSLKGINIPNINSYKWMLSGSLGIYDDEQNYPFCRLISLVEKFK